MVAPRDNQYPTYAIPLTLTVAPSLGGPVTIPQVPSPGGAVLMALGGVRGARWRRPSFGASRLSTQRGSGGP